MQRLNVASLQILQNGLSFGHQRKANRLYLKNASEKMTQLLLPPETLLASSRQQHVALCQNGWNLMQDSRILEKTTNSTSANRRQKTMRNGERALSENLALPRSLYLVNQKRIENSISKKI